MRLLSGHWRNSGVTRRGSVEGHGACIIERGACDIPPVEIDEVAAPGFQGGFIEGAAIARLKNPSEVS
jgi:hypothetical protein